MSQKPDPILENISDEAQQRAKEEIAPAPERHWRGLVFQAYVIAAISTFAVLAFLARGAAYFSLDVMITRTFQAHGPSWTLELMRAVSWPGFAPQAAIVVLLVFLFFNYLGLRRESIFSLAAGFGSLLANTLVKVIIARPRPAPDLVNVFRSLSSYSFPSGHVMFYTAFFGFLAFLTYTQLKRSWLRLLLILLYLALVALVGPSRIYLGDHWASDVLGGYLLGSLTLLAVIWGYRLPNRVTQKNQLHKSETKAQEKDR